MLKAYYWKPEKDDDCCVAIIAESVKEAKNIGWSYWGQEHGNNNSYIECRCSLIKNREMDISGLPKGAIDKSIDIKECLRRNIYGYIQSECDKCKQIEMVSLHKDKLICYDCLDEIENSNDIIEEFGG